MENKFQEEAAVSPVATTEETTRETDQDAVTGDASFEEEEDLNDESEIEEAEDLGEETDKAEEA